MRGSDPERRSSLTAVQQEIAIQCAGTRSVVAAGFPCQPYSVMGSQTGLADPRGQVLFSVLQVAWRTQAVALVLECVAEVASFASTLDVIRGFAQKARFRIHEVILDLQDQWASRRRRWWAVLVPLDVACRPIPVWPDARAQWPIARVIPEWPAWDPAVEASLHWTPEEAARYEDAAYGNDPRALNLQGKAPTAVHSWGCALSSCPCGCRQFAFSDSRLRTGGLRGVGIIANDGKTRRHLHPSEAGLLNGIPASFCYPQPARSGLCLVGQVSSPLQSLWVYAHLLQATDAALLGSSDIQPLQELAGMQQQLLQQQQDMWSHRPLHGPSSVVIRVGGYPLQVDLPGPITVGTLLHQEGLKVPGFTVAVFAGRQLDDQDYVPTAANDGELRVSYRPKRQANTLPGGNGHQIHFLTSQGPRQCQCPAGTLIAALCCACDVPLDLLTSIDDRVEVPPSHRVQASMLLDARPVLPSLPLNPAIADAVLAAAVQILLEDSESDAQLLHPACSKWLLALPLVDFPPEAPALQPNGHFLALFSSDGHWACLHARP